MRRNSKGREEIEEINGKNLKEQLANSLSSFMVEVRDEKLEVKNGVLL